MKKKIEWQDGQVWRSVIVDLGLSRHGNWTFKHSGKVYVFKEKREGEQVLVLEDGQWVKAARVARDCIFLGPGMSSREYYATLEGRRSVQELFNNFALARRRR
jgi:hypothetical protein